MRNFVLKGNLIYAPAPDRLELCPDSFLVCENGACAGVFGTLPEQYAALPVHDHGDALLIPGYTDLHLHAPQYENLGLGLGMELLAWLEKLTYPAESRYADVLYADTAYDRFTKALRKSFTTRAVVFATTHTPATMLLMEKLESSGLRSFVGRLSMDRNSPEGLCELSARTALESVEEWLTAVSGRFAHTAPILTPRFAPSCTDELMEGLGVLADVYGLPVQSHLSETPEEVAWVKRLYPGSGSYADVYRRFGLLGSGTVMAHCVYLENEEVDIMRDAGSFVAHCPVSNTNLRSGIAPVTKYMDAGLRVGLGSDISGSHTLDMSEVLREALRVSGLHWRARGGEGRKLSPLEAFYLVTKGGGSFFGKNGSFEPGYAFDVLAIDDAWEGEAGPYSLAQRFERMLYLCSAREIRAKYVQGERLL